jgi:hypothetical protein
MVLYWHVLALTYDMADHRRRWENHTESNTRSFQKGRGIMKPAHVRVIVPETPIYVEACAAETSYVGLGQPPNSEEYRAFILIQVPGVADQGVLVHVSLDDARFLREALDTVIARHRALTSGTN